MNKSYTFIGTSYLNSCEDGYPSFLFANNSNSRFYHQTNLIQEVSKRNPNNTIYNCSEDGHGITTYFRRILTLLNRYNPDVFVFEIPNGQRMLAHTRNEYGENYDIHFPVQVLEAGLPQNLDEEFREVSASIIDDCQTLMTPDELNKYWSKHTNMPFHFGGKQWQGYTTILSNFDDGRKSRFSDVIAQCEIINDFLVSKNKEVYWFSWWPEVESQLTKVNSNKMTFLNPNYICQWKYEKDIGTLNSPEPWRQHLKQFCHDNSHLHSKYMPEFAEYFDQIFK